MKKLGARLAVLGILLMIAVGCGSEDDVTEIRLSMTENEVIAVLGEPDYKAPSTNNEQGRFIYYGVDDQDITVLFMDGRVSKIWYRRSPFADFGSPP